MLFVFSKARNGTAYYLTCIDAKMGKLIWEKPILAPRFIENKKPNWLNNQLGFYRIGSAYDSTFC